MIDDAAGQPRLVRDPWSALRAHTAARIALGRAGGSLPTSEVLDFALSHAGARDAVHSQLDPERLGRGLEGLGLPRLLLHSQAADRATYLRRPDLGRRLDDASRRTVAEAHGDFDVCLILADGLSATAVHEQTPPLLRALVPILQDSRLSLAPLCVVSQARVAIEDEIGQALGARCAVILIGERPGLRSADSLGAYLVFDPEVGRTDADRNCVSNIRPAGLSISAAAGTLHHLITEAIRRRVSGVALKDERDPARPINVAQRKSILR